MGHNDELIRNKSAFASEMSDAAAIVQYADKNSLVVLDELARSTSTEEGIAITYAICEKVLKLQVLVTTKKRIVNFYFQSYTFLATHFLDIAALANYSNAIDKWFTSTTIPFKTSFFQLPLSSTNWWQFDEKAQVVTWTI